MNRSPKALFSLVLGVAALLLCAFVVRGRLGNHTLNLGEELDSAKGLGLPVSATELESKLSVPSNQNAAPGYLKIIEQIRQDADLRHGLVRIQDGSFDDASPKSIEAAVAVLPTVAPALKATAEAAALPHCAFPQPWADAHKLGFPEVSRLKKLAQALAFDAWQKSERGDWRGALAEIASAEKVGFHIGEEPTMLAFAARNFCEANTQRLFARVIQRNRNDGAFLAAAQETNAHFSPLSDPRRPLLGETVMGISAIDKAQSIQEFEGGNAPPVDKGVDDSVITADERQLMKAKLLHACRETYKALPVDSQRWEQIQQVGGDMENKVQADKTQENMPALVRFPHVSVLGEGLARMEMRRRQTDTVLRLLQERLKTGKFPTALPSDWVTASDPFSRKLFGYRVEGDGFTLYSVGADGADNGGVPRTTTRRKNYDEIVKIS